jgi:hypothetical protein
MGEEVGAGWKLLRVRLHSLQRFRLLTVNGIS